jgi:hypothetical protein
MRKLISIIFAYQFLVSLSGYCQQVIATSGNYQSTTTGSISWTLGETLVTTCSAGSKILTQGFQQANITVLPSGLNQISYGDIVAYPNPATEFIKLKIENITLQGASFSIADLQGKNLLMKQPVSDNQLIDLSSYATGVYLLTVWINQQPIKVFKIIKN